MIFHLHIPAMPLHEYVADVFYYEAGAAPYEAEKFLPDNTIYLILNFTAESKKLYSDITLNAFTDYKKAWISGMQKKYIVIEATNNNKMMVVRFKPGKAFAFFNMPLHELCDKVFESDDIIGDRVLGLRDEIGDIDSPAEKCKCMERFLHNILLRDNNANPVIDYLVTQLENPNRQNTIRELVAKTGYSHKHVINLFEQYVGLTPKYFSRVAKFQQLLAMVDKQQYFSWTSIANEYGFYDQSHFIHEFRKFSGINPTDYMLAKGQDFNYLPVSKLP